ncbi:hypothetical protein CI102_14923 [Trichoderma harzianum]|nr:hypothetical protein CI102_14923 [Trichoderma harzianum]
MYRRLSQQQLPPVVYSNFGLAFALGPPAEKSCPTPPAASNLTRPTPILNFRELHQPTSHASPINSHQFSAAKPVAPTPQTYAPLPNKAPLFQSIKCQMQKINAQNEQMAGKELDLSAMPPHRYVRAGSTTPSFIDNCLDNQPHQPHQFRPRLIYFLVQRSNRVDRSSSGADNWHKAKAITANMQGKLASQAWSSEAPRTLL